MERTLSLFESTIGKKAILAVTGLALYGFVIFHMLGNLQVYLGPERFNGYAALIKHLGGLLWLARGGLFACAVAHVVVSMSLVVKTAGARSVGYRKHETLATTYAALTMRYGGPAILCFIVFHIAHFTYPGIGFGYRHEHTDVYSNFVHGFSVPWIAAIYIVANLFLGLHLYHGAWSLFQTLGIRHPRYDAIIRFVPRAIGIAVAVGNISMPLAVLTGWIH